MFAKKHIAYFASLLLLSSSVMAELFVVKEVGGKVVPLDASDWNNYKGNDGIFGILQKYQWPMNTVSDLTKEEIRELFAEKPDAERIFIEKKIQEKFPESNYKVIFIPTTLYELFAILMVYDEPFGEWDNIRTQIFEKEMFKAVLYYFKNSYDLKLQLNNAVVLNELLAWGYLVRGKAIMDGFLGFSLKGLGEIRRLIHNEDEIQPTEIRKKIFALYTDTNNHKESARVHFLFNWYLGYHMLNTYDKKDLYDIAANVIKNIDLKSTNTVFASKKTKYCNACIKGLSQESRTSFPVSSIKRNELNENSQLKPDGIIARTLKLELDAQQKNMGLLFRGASLVNVSVPIKAPFDKKGKILPTEKKKVIGSSLRTKVPPEERSFEGIAKSYKEPSKESSFKDFAKLYKEDAFKPYSISYGITLFAGLFFDSLVGSGAMAYGSLCKYNGYALRINKLQYRFSLKTQSPKTALFFIPPVNTLVGLFAVGEFFHARAKACISKDPTKFIKKIKGIAWFRGPDYSGLFLIQADPLEHAAKFSQFIADNATILNVGSLDNFLPGEEEGLIKAAQKETAQYFGAIPKIKRFIDKVHTKIKKMIEEKAEIKK